MDAKVRAESKKLMSNPASWPRWPILPVIKRKNNPECAVMLAMEGKLTTLFFINLYEIGKETKWNEVPQKDFGSIDAILDAGWEVD